MWSEQLCPRGSIGGQPLAYLGNAFFCLSLLGQHPALQDSPHCQPERKSLLGTEGNGCFCPLLGRLVLSTELMERGRKVESKSQAKRVRQLPGEGQHIVIPLQGLIRIAKTPRRPSRVG